MIKEMGIDYFPKMFETILNIFNNRMLRAIHSKKRLESHSQIHRGSKFPIERNYPWRGLDKRRENGRTALAAELPPSCNGLACKSLVDGHDLFCVEVSRFHGEVWERAI